MERSKRGQVSIFVILAIVVVVGVALFFVVRGNFGVSGDLGDFEEVVSFYEGCIQEEARDAVGIAGVQGGHVYVDDFVQGSDYAPFGNQLNFLGFGVPYWFGVSGNGVIQENVPTQGEVEEGIARFVEEGIARCDFESFEIRGYNVELEEPNVEVSISGDSVEVESKTSLVMSNADGNARVTSRSVEVNSKLGDMLNTARGIYQKEQEELFLENYAVDILNSYAPVTGNLIQCSPGIWQTQEVVNELEDGLEGNIGSLRFSGDASSESAEYFLVDHSVEGQVRALYDRSWPHKIEIAGAGQDVMVAEPTGNQEGMGIMGFCYVPYHFVYDISIPVMFQIIEGEEVFQFPVVVIVDNNVAREAALTSIDVEPEEVDICSFPTQDLEVRLFDNELNSVDGRVQYACFDQLCDLGETNGGSWTGQAPSCFNGELVVRAEGYNNKRELFSSSEESAKDIFLDRIHEVQVELNVDGRPFDGQAIVSFDGPLTASTELGINDRVTLTEGSYDVRVMVYSDSDVKLPATTKTECVEVARSGFLGIFGGKDERCFDIEVPETNVDFALVGGGESSTFLLESQLESGIVSLSVQGLPKPTSLDQLQANYALFETRGVTIR